MTSPNVALLLLMLVAAVWTVMASSLLKSAIGLALTSVVLTILMFQLDSPLAAVFELSICAGLITVVFISAISLTKPLSAEQEQERILSRVKRFALLPVMLAVVAAVLCFSSFRPDFSVNFRPNPMLDVRHVLWQLRRFDLVGQIIVILAGVFGIVVLFKHRSKGRGGR